MASYILAFIGIALFPLILAGYGGHLATLALPDPKKRRAPKVIVWSLAALSIIFAGLQQIDQEKKQQESDAAHDRKQQEIQDKLDGSIRSEEFVKGQLSELAIMVSKVGNDGPALAALAKILASQSSVDKNSKPYPANLANVALKKDTAVLVNGVRSLVNDYDFQTQQVSAKYQKLERPLVSGGTAISKEQKDKLGELSNNMNAEFSFLARNVSAEYEQRFKVEAALLHEELLSRLPRDERFSVTSVRNADHYITMNANPFRMRSIPDDLERLSKMLPD